MLEKIFLAKYMGEQNAAKCMREQSPTEIAQAVSRLDGGKIFDRKSVQQWFWNRLKKAKLPQPRKGTDTVARMSSDPQGKLILHPVVMKRMCATARGVRWNKSVHLSSCPQEKQAEFLSLYPQKMQSALAVTPSTRARPVMQMNAETGAPLRRLASYNGCVGIGKETNVEGGLSAAQHTALAGMEERARIFRECEHRAEESRCRGKESTGQAACGVIAVAGRDEGTSKRGREPSCGVYAQRDRCRAAAGRAGERKEECNRLACGRKGKAECSIRALSSCPRTEGEPVRKRPAEDCIRTSESGAHASKRADVALGEGRGFRDEHGGMMEESAHAGLAQKMASKERICERGLNMASRDGVDGMDCTDVKMASEKMEMTSKESKESKDCTDVKMASKESKDGTNSRHSREEWKFGVYCEGGEAGRKTGWLLCLPSFATIRKTQCRIVPKDESWKEGDVEGGARMSVEDFCYGHCKVSRDRKAGISIKLEESNQTLNALLKELERNREVDGFGAADSARRGHLARVGRRQGGGGGGGAEGEACWWD